jgi:hypothetical protein
MGIVLTPSVYKAKPVLNKKPETGGQQVQNDLQQGGWQQQGGGWQQQVGGSWQQQGGGWQQLGSGWQQQGGGWQGSGWGPGRGSQWNEGTAGVAEDQLQLQGRDATGVDDKAATAQAAEGMFRTFNQNTHLRKLVIVNGTDTVCFTCMFLYVRRIGDGYPVLTGT